MSKDPAFLLYSKDWLQGTAEFMPNEKGVYIDLLCHQHQNKSLPVDPNRLCRLVGLSLDEFNKIWSVIKCKFVEENGRLFNKKLDAVISERESKAHKNKLLSVFAILIRNSEVGIKVKDKIKKNFDVNVYVPFSTEEGADKITEWFNRTVNQYIEDEDEDINNKGGTGEKETLFEVYSFDNFWNDYGKKVGREKCEKKWVLISEQEKLKIKGHVPKYVLSTPEVKFRKDPQTYLNGKCWDDEIIFKEQKTEQAMSPRPSMNFVKPTDEV